MLPVFTFLRYMSYHVHVTCTWADFHFRRFETSGPFPATIVESKTDVFQEPALHFKPCLWRQNLMFSKPGRKHSTVTTWNLKKSDLKKCKAATSFSGAFSSLLWLVDSLCCICWVISYLPQLCSSPLIISTLRLLTCPPAVLCFLTHHLISHMSTHLFPIRGWCEYKFSPTSMLTSAAV